LTCAEAASVTAKTSKRQTRIDIPPSDSTTKVVVESAALLQ
jgi:hypothetical protein